MADLGQAVLQVVVQEAGEVSVKALIAGDELVGEGEPGHEQALLEPEDSAEGATEVDTLHASKGHQPLRKAHPAANPLLRPARLLGHAWQRLGCLHRRHSPFFLYRQVAQQELLVLLPSI